MMMDPRLDLGIVAAAHELKTPLALVRQLGLALDTEGLTMTEYQELARQIVLTSEKALRLTTDLTRSARLEDGLFNLEPINPRHICEEVAHEIAPLYAAHGRTLQVRSGRPSLVVGHRDLLRRVLLNFADNALHYADDRGVVELRTALLGGCQKVRIAVSDHGPAMSLPVWRRLQNTTGTPAKVLHVRPQSSGLGIYIAHQFAAAMQGRVGLTRRRDGATFYIELPVSSQLALL